MVFSDTPPVVGCVTAGRHSLEPENGTVAVIAAQLSPFFMGRIGC